MLKHSVERRNSTECGSMSHHQITYNDLILPTVLT